EAFFRAADFRLGRGPGIGPKNSFRHERGRTASRDSRWGFGAPDENSRRREKNGGAHGGGVERQTRSGGHRDGEAWGGLARRRRSGRGFGAGESGIRPPHGRRRGTGSETRRRRGEF